MNTKRKRIALFNDGLLKNKFSILTYNILADCHVVPCRQSNYSFVEDEFLLKTEGLTSKRHLLVIKELKHFNTDVMLLQEVEDWYSPLLQCELKEHSYEYLYFQKVGVPEGSALFYKKERFELLNKTDFFIHDEIARICQEKVNVGEDVANELLEPTVAIIATLKDVSSGKIIIIASTHIIYKDFVNPARQCLQACLITQKISDIRLETASTQGVSVDDIAVVFGGDFNGEPEHMTIQAMKNGVLSKDQFDKLKKLSYEVKDRQAVSTETSEESLVTRHLSFYLNNPLQLSCAYYDVRSLEPSITSSEDSYAGCLDYIFYSSGLKVVSVIDMGEAINEDYIGGGPNKEFGSDHLPLVAEFAF